MILTPGNVDDHKPIPDLLKGLYGKFFAAPRLRLRSSTRRGSGSLRDQAYVSQELANQLLKEYGIEFFTKPRRNMLKHH